MLTVHSEISDKVDLLSLGADDYITKPFAFSELLARVKTILRRPRNRIGSILKFDNILLDTDKCSVTRAKEKISLSFKEFSLLEYFMINPGRVLSRREIMEHIWDENADPFSNTIEVHIMNLRKKLEQYGHNLIFTVPNRGYKLAQQD
jgi:DNA-binding response OmpR family regulator